MRIGIPKQRDKVRNSIGIIFQELALDNRINILGGDVISIKVFPRGEAFEIFKGFLRVKKVRQRSGFY